MVSNTHLSRNSPTTLKQLVELLTQGGFIKTKKVQEAMSKVDRREFVGQSEQSLLQAYQDTPLSLNFNVVISAPCLHASCLSYTEEAIGTGA